jgi:hypothetical protein
MTIDSNLLAVSKVIFSNKKNWKFLTIEQKEEFFFTFNRFFSKKYTDQSFLLNSKNINKESAFDTWYYFMIDKEYPNWFWSKSEKTEKTNPYIKIICKKYDLHQEDFYLIEKLYPEEIKEEINYLKKLEKQ